MLGHHHLCRCEACAEAWREYRRWQYYRLRRGLPAPVDLWLVQSGRMPSSLADADAARSHLSWLLERGATAQGVADAARLDVKTVTGLLDGRATSRDCLDRVLGVTLGEALVASRHPGVAARLLAVMRERLGLSADALARCLGLGATTIRMLERGRRRDALARETWDRIVTGYRLLARRGLVPADVLAEEGLL